MTKYILTRTELEFRAILGAFSILSGLAFLGGLFIDWRVDNFKSGPNILAQGGFDGLAACAILWFAYFLYHNIFTYHP